MTITTAIPHDVRKDRERDRRTDVETVAGKAGAKDGRAGTGAFVIVLANHKGGVTKTTSTANLGAMLAEAGRRVLIVDCDPQANLSEASGWIEELPGERLEDLLAHPDASPRSRCSPTSRLTWPGVSSCGSSRAPTRSPMSPPTSPAPSARDTSTNCGPSSSRYAAGST
jgi:hypothetical protein